MHAVTHALIARTRAHKHSDQGYGSPLVCKLRFSMDFVHKNYHNLRWLLRVTDDTYVNVPNLMSYVALYKPTEARCFGEIYRYGSYTYPHGGAGWLLSRGLIDQMVPRMGEFMHMVNATGMDSDDVVRGLSKCVWR